MINLMPTILPPSVLGARLALAPSTPPTNLPAPVLGLRAGLQTLPSAPPPPSSLSRTVVNAIQANVSKEVTAPSAPTVPTGPTTGAAGSAGNAGQIAGADSTVAGTTPPQSNATGEWIPVVVLALAILGGLSLIKGE